jgi:ankyrin repeat protein
MNVIRCVMILIFGVLTHHLVAQNKQGVIRTLAESTDTSYFIQGDDTYNICMATLRGEILNVKLLVNRKTDINSPLENGQTAIMYAAQNGHLEICKYLLEKGAKFDNKSFDGRTALTHAIKAGQTEISALLIKNGANINSTDVFGRSPLIYAAFAGDSVSCSLLLTNGADISIKDDDGIDALLGATRNFREKTVQLLINKGANVNTLDWQGLTPLMVASGISNENILNALIAAHADVNMVTKKNETALTIAIQRNNKNIVEILINNGANVNQNLTMSEKPLTIAYYYKKNKEIINLLKQKGAKQNLLPDFKNFTFGPEFNFNLTDYMQGICIGAKDNKYNVDLQLGFHFRVADNSVIIEKMGQNLQLWEMRSLWYLSLNKNFEWNFPENDRKIGIHVGVKQQYSTGDFRGTKIEAINTYKTSPEIGVYTISNLIQLGVSYNYFDIGTKGISPHRIIIGTKLVFGTSNKLDFSIYKPWD